MDFQKFFLFDTGSSLKAIEPVTDETLNINTNYRIGKLTAEAILTRESQLRDHLLSALCLTAARFINYRGDQPFLQETELMRLVQLPRFPVEVEPFRPVDGDALTARFVFARNTGLLALGPGERWAALHRRPSDNYTFCAVYENSETGHVRSLAGYFNDNIDYAAKPVSIADLDVTQCKYQTSKYCGYYMWWHKELSADQSVKTLKTIQLLEDHLPNAPAERKESGAIIIRSFIENGSTESTGPMRQHRGWKRYPTHQDAWYFGVWINSETLETLTYAEQDVSLVKCENVEQFQKELTDMARYYGKHLEPSSFAYGEDGAALGFDSLYLVDKPYTEVVFADTATIDKDKPSRSQAPMMLAVRKQALERAKGNLHQVVELKQDEEFGVNILDPLLQGEAVTVALRALGDGVEVSLTLAATKETVIAKVALEREATST